MPLITLLTLEEQEKYSKVSDPKLNELFQEIREKFNYKFFLREHTHVTKRLLRPDKVEEVYMLYFLLSGISVQIINFSREPKTTEIRTCVDKTYIVTFLYGLLNGMNLTNKLHSPVHPISDARLN